MALDFTKLGGPSDVNSMVIGVHSILSQLLFHQDSFREFEAAIQDLGEHLGFVAHRPEIDFGNGGPDDLWAVGGHHFVMIECKNEATAPIISKDYVDKSAGRRHWFASTYGPGCTADSVMVHPSYVVSHYAAPDPTCESCRSRSSRSSKQQCDRSRERSRRRLSVTSSRSARRSTITT